MKTPFKVGDRVRVYGAKGANALKVFDGKVTNDDLRKIYESDERTIPFGIPWRESGLIQVDGCVLVYPQQCRKLVKKPRRRVWVIEQDGHLRYGTWNTERFNQSEVIGYGNNCREIEFIEVPRPKWRTADVVREEG